MPRRPPVAESVAVVAGRRTLVVLAFGAEPWGWWGGDVYQWLPPLSAHRDPELHGWLVLAVASPSPPWRTGRGWPRRCPGDGWWG